MDSLNIFECHSCIVQVLFMCHSCPPPFTAGTPRDRCFVTVDATADDCCVLVWRAVSSLSLSTMTKRAATRDGLEIAACKHDRAKHMKGVKNVGSREHGEERRTGGKGGGRNEEGCGKQTANRGQGEAPPRPGTSCQLSCNYTFLYAQCTMDNARIIIRYTLYGVVAC
jgi:hypothetical protein